MKVFSLYCHFFSNLLPFVCANVRRVTSMSVVSHCTLRPFFAKVKVVSYSNVFAACCHRLKLLFIIVSLIYVTLFHFYVCWHVPGLFTFSFYAINFCNQSTFFKVEHICFDLLYLKIDMCIVWSKIWTDWLNLLFRKKNYLSVTRRTYSHIYIFSHFYISSHSLVKMARSEIMNE